MSNMMIVIHKYIKFMGDYFSSIKINSLSSHFIKDNIDIKEKGIWKGS